MLYPMADGLNEARAMRVAEIMADYTNIQTYIASIRANLSAEEYNEDGFVVIRSCMADAQNLLAQPFHIRDDRGNIEEKTKAQLRRIIVDASVRRFAAQRIYLRIVAALRWVNSRAAVLQNQRPHTGHAPALQQIHNTLHAELASVTDERIELSLRSADAAAGKWLQEDPSLAMIQRMTHGTVFAGQQ